MPEHDCLPPDTSATDFVSHLALMSGLPRTAARERTAEVLRHVGLYEERYRAIGGYSTGMKQRVKLAQALVHDPRLLLLDEPTNGLDPAGRDEMLELVHRTGTEFGIATIVASHLLGEIERVCDYLVAIEGGQLLRSAPLGSFTERTGTLAVEVEEGSAGASPSGSPRRASRRSPTGARSSSRSPTSGRTTSSATRSSTSGCRSSGSSSGATGSRTCSATRRMRAARRGGIAAAGPPPARRADEARRSDRTDHRRHPDRLDLRPRLPRLRRPAARPRPRHPVALRPQPPDGVRDRPRRPGEDRPDRPGRAGDPARDRDRRRPDARRRFGAAASGIEEQSPIRYDTYFSTISTIVVLFCAAQAPELFGRDQRHGILSLYFARALRRSDYALARIAGFVAALLLLSSCPQLVLFLGRVAALDGHRRRGPERPAVDPADPHPGDPVGGTPRRPGDGDLGVHAAAGLRHGRDHRPVRHPGHRGRRHRRARLVGHRELAVPPQPDVRARRHERVAVRRSARAPSSSSSTCPTIAYFATAIAGIVGSVAITIRRFKRITA